MGCRTALSREAHAIAQLDGSVLAACILDDKRALLAILIAPVTAEKEHDRRPGGICFRIDFRSEAVFTFVQIAA